MKNANTTASLSLSPDSITVNGRTFPASYSLARTGDVYVFASVKTAADAEAIPVRLHISANMPMHAEAVAAAEASRKASKPAAQEAAPAPVQEQPAPAPVQEATAPADKPAPAKKASRKASKPVAQEAAPAPVQEQSAPATAPAQEAPAPADKPAPAKKASKPVAQEAAPAPVQEQPAPVAGKAWIGTTIQGKGWSIAFDADAGRTRVQVDGTPTDAQRSAIEQAGFYWSSQLKSWNKKLTCKAYRAAQALATTLNALA